MSDVGDKVSGAKQIYGRAKVLRVAILALILLSGCAKKSVEPDKITQLKVSGHWEVAHQTLDGKTAPWREEYYYTNEGCFGGQISSDNQRIFYTVFANGHTRFENGAWQYDTIDLGISHDKAKAVLERYCADYGCTYDCKTKKESLP